MRIPIHKTTSSSTEHDERAVPSRRARGERSRGRLTRRRFFLYVPRILFARGRRFFGSLGCDFSSGVNAARAWGSRDLAGEPIPAARVRTLVSSLGTKHAGEVRGLRLRSGGGREREMDDVGIFCFSRPSFLPGGGGGGGGSPGASRPVPSRAVRLVVRSSTDPFVFDARADERVDPRVIGGREVTRTTMSFTTVFIGASGLS